MLYKLKNKTTGEIREELMKVEEKEKFLQNNPEWVNVLDSVPRVVFKGLGWQAAERREDLSGQAALDNANRERDGLEYAFKKGQGIYKEANYAHDKAVESAINQSHASGNDLSDMM